MASEPSQRRGELYALLGDLPPRDRPISAESVKLEERDGYLLETLSIDLNGIEPVPAYLARPAQMSGPAPAVLYNHAHGGNYDLGKDEFVLGRPALQSPPYAKLLTDMGYCALGIDCWNFGERKGRTESELFKELLWKGQVLWGLMVYDSLRALDYLASRSEVDPQRLATIGLSMGSTMAWWLAALDERIRVCVDLCCLTDFEELIRTRGLDGHGIYYYVPGLLKHFTTSQINNLIAPRAHLAIAGNHDRLTPPAGLDKIDASAREAYAAMGAAEGWRMLRYETGHFETAHARQAVAAWLKTWL
ncbi:MAG: acetylxylan esterase [Anaerolineae bacterium]|nr:acetylxylan esterase [Anaerolineae bacterium]